MSSQRFNTVKRKLETMKYSEPLDQLSVPLAEHLVDDLVQTTESYRNLKLQHNKTVQEFGNAADKLSAMSKEQERLVLENNILHLETIKASESKDDVERRLYQRLKSQEEKIAEFNFWKDQNFEKFQKMEKENGLLRKQLAEIRPGFVGAGLSKKLRDSDPGEKDTGPPKDSVIHDLKQQLLSSESANQELQLEIQGYKTKVENREAEIKRLGSEAKGSLSLDKIVAQEREEEREYKMKGLTQQNEYLSEKLTSYEDLHASYNTIEEEKYELIKKLDDVMGKNKELAEKLVKAESMTAADVESEQFAVLKDTMAKYEDEIIELSDNLSKERNLGRALQAKLAIVNEAQERVEGSFQEKNAAYESARWRVNQLEVENKNLIAKVEEMMKENESLAGKLKDLPVKDSTIDHLEKMNKELSTKLGESQSEVRRYMESLKATNELMSQRSEEANAFVSVKIELESKVTELEKRNQLLLEENAKKDKDAQALKEKSRLRSSDNARMEVVLKNLESELNSTKTMNTILNDKVSMLTEEKKTQEPVIKKLRVEYNDLQESTSAKIAEMHSQILDFTKQMMEQSEKLSSTGKSLEEVTKERNELAMELSHNKSEKSLGDRENSLLNNQVKTMTAEKDRVEQKLSTLTNEVQMKDIELKALQQEVKHLKDQSADMRSVLQEKSNDLAKSEEEKTSLQEKLQNSNELVEKQKKDLNDAQTRVVSNFSQEEDIKTQVALEQANVLKYKSLYDKTRAELNIMKDQISNISSLEDTLQQELYYAKSEADERLFEINQLKSLISQLDYTQSKLVDKLKLTIAELEETKRSKKEIEDMCSMQDEAKSEVSVEVSKLKSVIKDMDGDKDKLQNELDSKCERIKKLEEVVENQSMELHSAKIELSNSQIKIRDVEQGFKSFKDEYDSILGQCKRLHADNLAIQNENSNARQEINALSEDMTQMAREQQIVNADLVKAVNERNNLQDEFQVLQRKTIEQEKIIEMKLKEIKEYTIAYKDLGIDNQEVLAKISHLEREIMEKNALLVAKDSELSSMNDILSNLEVENRQAVSDLTSYEAATSELTNALSTAESQIDKESRDKVALIERANISKQNALQLESTRNAMQNELYKMEVKTENLSKTLENVRDENVYLREQLAQQDSKEKNLESIIADFRNRTFASEQVGKEVEASDSYMILQADLEKTRADFEKVSKLYSELKETSLAESAHSFGIADATKEIESLRTDNERLIDLLAKAETETTELRAKADEAMADNKALQKATLASPSKDSEGSPPSSKSTPGKSPRSKLQEQLQALKQENLRLRSNLEATQATVGKMGSEINKVRAEYESVVREFTGLGDE